MKRTFAIALFALAALIADRSAAAQTQHQAHYQTVQYAVPPVPVMTVCEINGVDYQIDYSSRIWGVNGFGRWFVIGRILATPGGPIAVRNDGVRFPAICQ